MNTDKIYAEAIANEYAPKNDSKVLALKKLDRQARMPAEIFTYTLGIVAALVVGLGMCLSMHVIGGSSSLQTAAGVGIGLAGFGAMGVNYPLYKRITKIYREKYAADIIRLANQISSETK